VSGLGAHNCCPRSRWRAKVEPLRARALTCFERPEACRCWPVVAPRWRRGPVRHVACHGPGQRRPRSAWQSAEGLDHVPRPGPGARAPWPWCWTPSWMPTRSCPCVAPAWRQPGISRGFAQVPQTHEAVLTKQFGGFERSSWPSHIASRALRRPGRERAAIPLRPRH